MNDDVNLLITLSNESQHSLLKCAVKLSWEIAREYDIEHPMSFMVRGWLHAQLPKHIRSCGPIVDVERIDEVIVSGMSLKDNTLGELDPVTDAIVNHQPMKHVCTVEESAWVPDEKSLWGGNIPQVLWFYNRRLTRGGSYIVECPVCKKTFEKVCHEIPRDNPKWLDPFTDEHAVCLCHVGKATQVRREDIVGPSETAEMGEEARLKEPIREEELTLAWKEVVACSKANFEQAEEQVADALACFVFDGRWMTNVPTDRTRRFLGSLRGFFHAKRLHEEVRVCATPGTFDRLHIENAANHNLQSLVVAQPDRTKELGDEDTGEQRP
jgi:hypothetical protein